MLRTKKPKSYYVLTKSLPGSSMIYYKGSIDNMPHLTMNIEAAEVYWRRTAADYDVAYLNKQEKELAERVWAVHKLTDRELIEVQKNRSLK